MSLNFFFLKSNFSNLINFIFTNFIANKKQYYENLKLAINWNRVNRLFKLKYFSRFKHILNFENFKHDIALSDIFTGEEEFQPNQLENLMEIALIKNKPKFVKLLLEHGLNLKKFLTYRRIIFLYNAIKVSLNRDLLFFLAKFCFKTGMSPGKCQTREVPDFRIVK